jgi:hypothetical protein
MNQSEAIIQFIGLRCAGFRPFQGQPGEVYGGRYFPQLLGQDGSVARSARFVAQFYINRRGMLDATTGERLNHNDVVSLTFWNGRRANAGKGLADLAAKSINVGKEITLRCNLRMYDSRVFDVQTPIMKLDGTGQLTKRAISFSVRPNSLLWGDDSAKQIANEIQSWTGAINFISRPPQWAIENTPDAGVWKQIKEFRNGLVYQAGTVYGYALVVSDQPGATAGAGNVNPNLTQQVVQTVQNPVVQHVPQTVIQEAPPAHIVNTAMASQTGGQVRI